MLRPWSTRWSAAPRRRCPIASLGPMDAKLRALLDELQTSIQRSEADGVIDDEERAELRTIIDRLDGILREPEGEHEGLTESLEEAAIRFEGRHPTVAAAIHSAVHTLTGYGM